VQCIRCSCCSHSPTYVGKMHVHVRMRHPQPQLPAVDMMHDTLQDKMQVNHPLNPSSRLTCRRCNAYPAALLRGLPKVPPTPPWVGHPIPTTKCG
jgi:hypothetical protein